MSTHLSVIQGSGVCRSRHARQSSRVLNADNLSLGTTSKVYFGINEQMKALF